MTTLQTTSDPEPEPNVGWLRENPLLTALIVALLAEVPALVVVFTEKVPASLQVLVPVAILLVNVLVAYVRSKVTPVANPKLAPDKPLVPATPVR